MGFISYVSDSRLVRSSALTGIALQFINTSRRTCVWHNDSSSHDIIHESSSSPARYVQVRHLAVVLNIVHSWNPSPPPFLPLHFFHLHELQRNSRTIVPPSQCDPPTFWLLDGANNGNKTRDRTNEQGSGKRREEKGGRKYKSERSKGKLKSYRVIPDLHAKQSNPKIHRASQIRDT